MYFVVLNSFKMICSKNVNFKMARCSNGYWMKYLKTFNGKLVDVFEKTK